MDNKNDFDKMAYSSRSAIGVCNIYPRWNIVPIGILRAIPIYYVQAAPYKTILISIHLKKNFANAIFEKQNKNQIGVHYNQHVQQLVLTFEFQRYVVRIDFYYIHCHRSRVQQLQCKGKKYIFNGNSSSANVCRCIMVV